MIRTTAAALVALSSLLTPAAAAPDSAGVQLRQRVEFSDAAEFGSGGADMAFSGRYVYALQRGPGGGVHVYERRGSRIHEAGFFPCKWAGTEVDVLRKGVVAFQALPRDLDDGRICTGAHAPGGAIVTLDVRAPAAPRVLGVMPVNFHTFSVHPTGRFIYTSGGGIGGTYGDWEIIDVSDPRKPRPVGPRGDDTITCHDIAFDPAGKVAACTAAVETRLWNVSDPRAPVPITTIHNPAIFSHHSGAFDPTGDMLVIGDEAWIASTCTGAPTGALWVYDVSDPANPLLQSTFSVRRGTPASSYYVDEITSCTAHNFEFVDDAPVLVAGWYTGGLTVVDLTNPLLPQEIAHYREDRTNYWGAYWHGGLIYTSDQRYGVDVFELQ